MQRAASCVCVCVCGRVAPVEHPNCRHADWARPALTDCPLCACVCVHHMLQEHESQRAHRHSSHAHQEPRVSAAAMQAWGVCRNPCTAACQPSPAFALPHSLPPLPATSTCRQLLVQFTTRDAQQPVARYGPKAGVPQYLAPAATATYGRADLCGAPATTLGFLDPGLLHTVALSGLEPGQRYYYSVGDAVSHLSCCPAAAAPATAAFAAAQEHRLGASSSNIASTQACRPALPLHIAGLRRLQPRVFLQGAAPRWPWRHRAHPGAGGSGSG